MEKVPTVHRTIREQVAAHLRYAVLSGELGEGEALREQPLARHFGVSRGPVRDALLQLTQEGLLVAEQNCGVRVRVHVVGEGVGWGRRKGGGEGKRGREEGGRGEW